MKPSANEFERIFSGILSRIPDGDPTKYERKVVFSCCLAVARSVEVIEMALSGVIAPALAELQQGAPAAVPAEEVETMPQLAQAAVVGSAPHLASNGGGIVTVSAPQPIAS